MAERLTIDDLALDISIHGFEAIEPRARSLHQTQVLEFLEELRCRRMVDATLARYRRAFAELAS